MCGSSFVCPYTILACRLLVQGWAKDMDGTYDTGRRDERVVIDSLWKAIWQMVCPMSAHAACVHIHKQEKFQVSIVTQDLCVVPDNFYPGPERAASPGVAGKPIRGQVLTVMPHLHEAQDTRPLTKSASLTLALSKSSSSFPYQEGLASKSEGARV